MYNNFKMTKEARAMRISIKFIIYDIYTNIPYFFSDKQVPQNSIQYQMQ